MIRAMCLGRVKIDEVAQVVSGFTAVLVLLLSHVQQRVLTSQANLGLPIEKPWIFRSFPYLIPSRTYSFPRLLRCFSAVIASRISVQPGEAFVVLLLFSTSIRLQTSLEVIQPCHPTLKIIPTSNVYPSLDVSRGLSALSSHIKDYSDIKRLSISRRLQRSFSLVIPH